MNISLRQCRKRFRTLRGAVDAIRDVDLEIRSGEFFVLLGPSGCGKSTLLNLIAGLDRLTAGEIRYAERPADAPARNIFLAPRERNAAMVFQSYALYPHLDVGRNIAFPLRIAKVPTAEIGPAVEKTARLLGIENLLDRKPAELSGGQRQRVAIARALVRKPRVFLLDEPLSNLDAQLRAGTRMELKRLQRELGVTTVYVTHDQTEAMTLGDRMALLKDGNLIQVGTPLEVYSDPQTPFAATFVGSPPMNLLPARVIEDAGRLAVQTADALFRLPAAEEQKIMTWGAQEVLVGIRPEHLQPAAERSAQALAGRVKTVEHLGRETLVHVEVSGQGLICLHSDPDYRPGRSIRLAVQEEKLHVFRK